MKPRFPELIRRAALVLTLAAGASARAECSRDIVTPVAPSGASFQVEHGVIKGIYADLLHNFGAKSACNFILSQVPRARQVALFENGQADLLVPASRTPKRDLVGVFVPLVGYRAMLISVASNRPAITSAQNLLERRDLRVAVVRGFDYGEQYDALLRELGKQGRLFVEVDVVAVARLLHAGSADLTIMGPTLMTSTIKHDKRVNSLLEHLRTEAIPELAWGHSGAYISRISLKPEDQALLHELFERIGKANAVMDGYLRTFRPEMLSESVRPR